MSRQISARILVNSILDKKGLTLRQSREMSKHYHPDREESHRPMVGRFLSESVINIGPFMTSYLELLLDLAEGEDRRLLEEKIVEVVFKRARLVKIMELINASRERLGKPMVNPVGMYRLYLNMSQKKELPRYRVSSNLDERMLRIVSRIDRKKYLEVHKDLSDRRYTMITRNNIHRPGIMDAEVFSSLATHMGKQDVENMAKTAIFKTHELDQIKEVSNFLEILDINLTRLLITAIVK